MTKDGNAMPQYFQEALTRLRRFGGRVGVVGDAPRGCYQALNRELTHPENQSVEIVAVASDSSCKEWVSGQEGRASGDRTLIYFDGEARSVANASGSEGGMGEMLDSNATGAIHQSGTEKMVGAGSLDEFLTVTREEISSRVSASQDSPRVSVYPIGLLAAECGRDRVAEFIIESGREVKQSRGIAMYHMDRGLSSSLVDEYSCLFDALVVLREQRTANGSCTVHRWLINERGENIPYQAKSDWIPLNPEEMNE